MYYNKIKYLRDGPIIARGVSRKVCQNNLPPRGQDENTLVRFGVDTAGIASFAHHIGGILPTILWFRSRANTGSHDTGDDN